MKIGGHISIAKGLLKALDDADQKGFNCLQIFSSSPRSLSVPTVPESLLAQFKIEAIKRNIGPNYVHAAYLVNLGSGNQDLRERSIANLIADLRFAAHMGFKGVVVHTGSHGGSGFQAVVPIVTDCINRIIENSPEDTMLFLEIASGGKGKIGSNFEELQTLLESVNSLRVGVCLDTAHLFAGGFGFDTQERLNNLSEMIASSVTWEKIGLIHTNDSKAAFGSYLDRHENIGKGEIGIEPFRLLINHEKFRDLPFIMEVPGVDGKGPDKVNADLLKSLI